MTNQIILWLLVFLAGGVAGAELRQVRSLDGEWQIAFDPGNEGREAGWCRGEVFAKLAHLRPIEVPSCWEEIKQDYEGVAVYGKRFDVPVAWKDRRVRLQFDAVNYAAEVWLNGHAIGRHEGGYGPFEFRVDDLLKPGADNFLSVRVLGPIVAQDKVIDGLGKNDAPHWRGAITGGIWQSVRLVASGPVMIDDVFITPRLRDDTALVQVAFDNTDPRARDARVEIEIRLHGSTEILVRKTAAMPLQPGGNSSEWTLPIPDARYWSPDEPNLYSATVRVVGSDEELVRFGMRELTIRDERFELNGKPVYIKAAFFEGLYPTRLALPDSREMAVREIRLAKEAGFNMIRPWRKPPPPMWLDLCDEMGVMVIGGLPIECMKRWPTATPQMPERIENELRTAILRDRSRACIVQWEIFNEIWRPELKRLKHPMSMLARELDPSRLILDESGGFAGGANIYLPGELEPVIFNDIHKYPGAPLDDLTYGAFLALGQSDAEIRALGLDPARVRNRHSKPGRMTLVSEIGYGSIPDLVSNNERFWKEGNPLVPAYRYHRMLEGTTRLALKDSGFDAVYPDLQDFCLAQQQVHSAANKRMIEAIRSNPDISGYCVHALTGGDWVLGAGILDLWREPKRSYQGTKEANAPRYLAIRVMPRNIYAEQGATVAVTGINDMQAVDGSLRVEIVDSAGKTVREWKQSVGLAPGVAPLLQEALDTAELVGRYEARVRLVDANEQVIANNKIDLDVFPPFTRKNPRSRVAVIDPHGRLTTFLKSKGVVVIPFDAETPREVPVFVTTVEAGNAGQVARFKALETFVWKGGTAVYLETLVRGGNPFWSATLPAKSVLPLEIGRRHAYGLWVGVSHIVRDHPIFRGLPVDVMMGQEYESVWAPYTLTNTGGELIAGSVSYGFHADNDANQHHLGPEPAFFGMDLGVVLHGGGRYILSALRLVENLGKDPVADKIVLNLVDWTTADRPR